MDSIAGVIPFREHDALQGVQFRHQARTHLLQGPVWVQLS